MGVPWRDGDGARRCARYVVLAVRAAVFDTFVGFTRDLEGPTSWMYLDVLGYVTTGYGNKIDDLASTTALAWRRPDGTLATRDEVVAEWSGVRNLRGQRNQRGVLWTDCGGGVFSTLTRLRLDAADVSDLVRRTIRHNDAALARRYPAWESWPSCAQMCCHSLAWACGTAYAFPKMDDALLDGDFAAAALETEMTKESNPRNNLSARNAANRILMCNAASVRDLHLDPDTINWTSLIGDVHDAPTLPDLTTAATHPTVAPEAIIHAIVDTVSEAQRRDE